MAGKQAPAMFGLGRETVPAGWEKADAFIRGDEVVILGSPEEGGDHNCDANGCGQDHVLARGKLSALNLRVAELVEAVREVCDAYKAWDDAEHKAYSAEVMDERMEQCARWGAAYERCRLLLSATPPSEPQGPTREELLEELEKAADTFRDAGMIARLLRHGTMAEAMEIPEKHIRALLARSAPPAKEGSDG